MAVMPAHGPPAGRRVSTRRCEISWAPDDEKKIRWNSGSLIDRTALTIRPNCMLERVHEKSIGTNGDGEPESA